MKQITCDIGELFADKYKDVTASLGGITLEEVTPFEISDECISGRVQTKENAPYGLMVICTMSVELAEQIVDGMSHGKVRSHEDVMLYIREYINIASGSAVSVLNNYVGKSVRFLVPEVQGGQMELVKTDQYESYTDAFLKSEYGEMILRVAHAMNCCLEMAE